jgi:hypothetical protein
MQPQSLAARLLPAETYKLLVAYSTIGVPTDCGPDWSTEAIEVARTTGPHVSALTPENVRLVWEELAYQVEAGFVKLIPEQELFRQGMPANIKISRLAVVPQRNRRGRMILNLSAGVELPPKRLPGQRRKQKRVQSAVNETTTPAEDQWAVKRLGSAMADALMFQFDNPCTWEVRWSKIDLSDGFWRMIVQSGQEHNFVYELPPNPGRPGKWFVIPSALQMGWTNSPAFFCTTTEATQQIVIRILALTQKEGDIAAHEYEDHCASGEPSEWAGNSEISMFLRVFVDDFIQAIAGPPKRPSLASEERWLTRATLHGIHSVFPSPEVTNHTGGRDSISLKKLIANDGRFLPDKIILGFAFNGAAGSMRTVGLSKDKATSYIADIRSALDRPQRYVSKPEFQKLHGRLNHASQVMPCMGGFMSELNKILASAHITVGLGSKSSLRQTLEDFAFMINQAHGNPSHIAEIVGTEMPHVYGYTDACRKGMGGVILPAMVWLPPTVWRFEFPNDITTLFDTGKISVNDLELAANFAAERMAETFLFADIAGLNSWFGSDNTATVSWKTKKAARAKSNSYVAPQILRAEAMLQRYTRRGPQDIGHIQGTSNLLGDFPSRSFSEHPANPKGDEAFLCDFSHRHPLPPQLGRWRHVHPTNAISLLTCSMLRGPIDLRAPTTTGTGGIGPRLPCLLDNIHSCRTPRPPPSTWNAHCCSWPLLSPYGKVDSTMTSVFGERRSRGRYANARSSWSLKDLRILGNRIQPTTGWPGPSQPI